MASKILVEHLELSCSICLEVFKDPRALNCLHNFCYGCLKGWVKKSRSNKTICCPLCKEVSPIPSGGLKTIKYNYFLADLVKRMDASKVKSKRKGAESKKEDMKLSEVTPFYCKDHPKNPIDQFCADCNFAACGTCLLRDHRHHKLVDIAEQAKISNKQLQHILKQTTTMIQLIDQQIDDSNKYDKQSTTDIKNTKKQINKAIDEMIDKLNQQRTQLFTSLDNIEKGKEQVMMTVRDGQDFHKAAMISLRSYTDNILHHGRNYDKVQQVRDIESRLASINKAQIPSFVWNCEETTASSHDMTVARVNMKTDVMEIEGMGGHVRGSVAAAGSVSDNIVAEIPLIRIGQRCVRALVEIVQIMWASMVGYVRGLLAGSVSDNIVTKIPLIEQGWPVTGLVVMGQTVWVVELKRSSLCAYPVTSPHQPHTFSIHGLSWPHDMVRFPLGQSQLVISDGNNKLLWVKLEHRNGVWRDNSQRSVKVTYHPRGLGVRDNQLLVCGAENVIHILSTSGEETHRVNMPQGVTPGKAVAQLTSPGFVIMDCMDNQVVLVTERGEIQHTYRGQEGFYPDDIVCHGHSIYVTDYAIGCVDELGVDGRHVRQLISGQGVRRPVRMCVDDTGRLYVVQGVRGNQEVWVIKTASTPTDTQATPGDRIRTQQTNMNLSVTWCD